MTLEMFEQKLKLAKMLKIFDEVKDSLPLIKKMASTMKSNQDQLLALKLKVKDLVSS